MLKESTDQNRLVQNQLTRDRTRTREQWEISDQLKRGLKIFKIPGPSRPWIPDLHSDLHQADPGGSYIPWFNST